MLKRSEDLSAGRKEFEVETQLTLNIWRTVIVIIINIDKINIKHCH